MSGSKNDKIIYAVFVVAILIFIVTVSILMFSKCADDSGEANMTPKATNLPGETPSGTISPDGTASSSAAVTTPTATVDPDSTPTPTPVPQHIIDKTVSATVKKKYYIEVSLKAQLVYIYEMTESGGKGQLVKAMICSTGREGEDTETPELVWVILENNIHERAKYRWQWLFNDVSGHYATRLFEVVNYGQSNESYKDRPYLFHSVPYDTYGRNDTLQWEEWNKLGTPASDGCIRLAVEDSKWIYDNVAAYSYVFTIQGQEDPMLWEALKREDIDASYKFDPTDYDYIASLGV